jgi:hypothetical protein
MRLFAPLLWAGDYVLGLFLLPVTAEPVARPRPPCRPPERSSSPAMGDVTSPPARTG